MMKVRARRQPEEAEIIIIPMIDTMMFSAQNVTLTVGPTGDLHLNTRPIAIADETAQLKALNISAGTLVIINADANVRHGVVTTVMDNARKAGVERFAIATQS